MKPTVYIETTVPSLLVARPSRDVIASARQQVTQEWWADNLFAFDAVTSPVVFDEAQRGDSEMADARIKALSVCRLLDPTEEVLTLGEQLAERLHLPERARADAFHISYSAVYGIDFLVTWNFTHINNRLLWRRIDDLCREAGFGMPVIGSPEELRNLP